MREQSASITARWVAMWRGLAPLFPSGMQLADDPLGLAFAPAVVRWAAWLARRLPLGASRLFSRGVAFELAAWMQLRTRAIDDEVQRFVDKGGRQILILGAGFDVRAQRLPGMLAGCTVYEVDHPATQQRKRVVLASRRASTEAVRFVPWDFTTPMSGLLPALQGVGLDPRGPVLTIWEGVTMYLPESAIEETVACVRSLGAPGSRLVFNYVDRARVRESTRLHRAAARVGEPMCFGWDPAALGGWMGSRGFQVVVHRSDLELAETYLPGDLHRRFHGRGGWLAVARPAVG